jgi:protocatechuate 3,4-dioxygenase beta subunit
MPVQIPPATADSNGHFAFTGLESGMYSLRAVADGYAQQDFNTRPGVQSGMTAQVNLTSGQAAKDIVLRLTPGGTVSGRVTGGNGEPLVNMEVSVLRPVYNPDGRRTMNQVGTAQTNDRGEYRIFWVAPGSYYLSVAGSNRPLPGVPFRPAAGSKYPRTFYPLTTDAATAALVPIQPAAELSGMDFRLAEQPTYRVRGRVVDSISGQLPSRGVSIGISARDGVMNTGMSSSSSPYNPVDGTFELRDVPSGSYTIQAQLPLNVRPQPGQPFQPPPVAIAAVEVRGADVDGIVLNFVPPVSISGRIRVEGDSSGVDFSRMSVSLRPAITGVPISMPRPAQASADGSFTMDGIVPGEYQFQFSPAIASAQAGFYVKSAMIGGIDVLAHSLTISGPVAGGVDIVLAKSAGRVTGTVRRDSPGSVSGVQVVLAPDQRDRRDLYKLVFSDPNGHFAFPTLPPGSYKVFAFESVDMYSWLDPNVLKGYESAGTSVTVGNAVDVTLDLKAIPPVSH